MKGLTLIMLLLLLAAIYTGAHHHTPSVKRGPYCQVGLLNVGVVNFVASAEECARIHDAIDRRIKHETT